MKILVYTEIRPGVFKSICGAFKCHKGIAFNFTDGTTETLYVVKKKKRGTK